MEERELYKKEWEIMCNVYGRQDKLINCLNGTENVGLAFYFLVASKTYLSVCTLFHRAECGLSKWKVETK